MSAIDDYFSTLAAPQKAELERIRKLVHKLIPEVQEVTSYAMPAFKYKNKYFAAFYSYKDHLSFFPTSEPVAAVKDKLKDFKWFKGTIQFTVEEPLPAALVKEIILFRMAMIDSGVHTRGKQLTIKT